MGDVELCLDSVSICFDVIFWVAFINGDVCQWDNRGRDNVSSVSLLLCGEVGVDNVCEVFVLSF